MLSNESYMKRVISDVLPTNRKRSVSLAATMEVRNVAVAFLPLAGKTIQNL